MYWQIATFIVSVLSLLASIYLCIRWERRRFFYILFSIGWVVNIVYYTSVLFVKFLDTHTWSQITRLVQAVMFGGWLIMDAFEGICQKIACSKFMQRLGEKWKTDY